MEREVLRDSLVDTEVTEEYLSEVALLKSFNSPYIMGKTKYSYSESIMNIINNFDDTKVNFPVLNHIILKSNKRNINKVLTLNNKSLLTKEISSIYNKNLKDLADPTINKDKKSLEFFKPFSLILFYQHGFGNSKLSINRVLDAKKFTDEMIDASTFFINDLESKDFSFVTLNNIFSKVIDVKNRQFIEYTENADQYNNPVKKDIDDGIEIEFDLENEENIIKTKIISDDDIAAYNTYLEKSNGVKPKEFFTPSTFFKEFYNSQTGKKEKAPHSTSWILQKNNLYNLVDKDGGEIVIENVDLKTGYKITNQPTQPPINGNKFNKKNLFTVTPIQSVDKKAIIKASIATQYIGFGEGIPGSSTETYRQQAGDLANTGNYSADDIIFVSVPGKRGTELQQKTQQDRTIKEAIKAIEAGATILTDNKIYIDFNKYNTGEQRLYKNMEAKGYNYSEITVDGQLIGTWSKSTQSSTSVPIKKELEGLNEAREVYESLFIATGKPPITFTVGVSTWKLNKNFNYDLIDQDTEEVLLANVNMVTGIIEEDIVESIPLTAKQKNDFIKDFEQKVIAYNLDELLSLFNINIQDVYKKINNATTKEDLIEIETEINNKLCQ
jgi:hypothetical protein